MAVMPNLSTIDECSQTIRHALLLSAKVHPELRNNKR